MTVNFNKVKNFMGTKMYLSDRHFNFKPKKTALSEQGGFKKY